MRTETEAERAEYLAERLPVENWLQYWSVRRVENRLRAFGLSQMQAKRCIAAAKQRMRNG